MVNYQWLIGTRKVYMREGKRREAEVELRKSHIARYDNLDTEGVTNRAFTKLLHYCPVVSRRAVSRIIYIS
jgi:hypothetical protein